jgi:acyl carrier protein
MQSADICLEARVDEIRKMLSEKLMVEVGSPDDDLLSTGLIDSLSLVQLLVTLEEQYAITIPLNELQLEDVRSVSSLANLVETRRAILDRSLVAVH